MKKIKNEPKTETEIKSEIKEDKEMIKQNKQFFEFREKLKELNKKELENLLKKNNQDIPIGKDAVILFI